MVVQNVLKIKAVVPKFKIIKMVVFGFSFFFNQDGR